MIKQEFRPAGIQSTHGLCAQFPPQFADHLWGLAGSQDEKHPISRTEIEFRRAGVRICEQCPVRMQCLASALTGRIGYGIYGGIPIAVRRRIAILARQAGLTIPTNSQLQTDILAHWLTTHPHALLQAKAEENRARRRRYHRQYRREHTNTTRHINTSTG